MNLPFAEEQRRSGSNSWRCVDAGTGAALPSCPAGRYQRALTSAAQKQLARQQHVVERQTPPQDPFYPVGVATRRLQPREKGRTLTSTNRNVLWVRALNDGMLKSKGKRLPSERAITIGFSVCEGFPLQPGPPRRQRDRFQKGGPDQFLRPARASAGEPLRKPRPHPKRSLGYVGSNPGTRPRYARG